MLKLKPSDTFTIVKDGVGFSSRLRRFPRH